MKPLKVIIESQEILFVDEHSLNEDTMIIEKEKSVETLNHLNHIEDLLIRHGHEGMTNAIDILTKVNDYLNGKNHKDFHVKTKFDGMGIVWGTHPETKQFFVGTKSVFNKTPKINYTNRDIKANHSSSPGLMKKLQHALNHLPKITPKNGVFQGDLMFTPGDIISGEKHLSFSPNTLTYNIDKESDDGKKLSLAKIGVAPHTYYEKKKNGEMHAKYDLDIKKFKQHPDVHIFDPSLKLESYLFETTKYNGTHQKHFSNSLNNAQDSYKKYLQTGGSENIKDHQDLLVGYINRTVREKRNPSMEGYVSFLNSQFKKKFDNLKLDSSKKNMKMQLDNEISNIIQRKDAFTNLFQTHKHLQTAKTHLVNALSRNSPYGETILGNKSKPEGFVISHKNVPVKLVDRQHFSNANFSWNEKVNPEDNPHVLTFSRMSVPTQGHERLLNTAADIARRNGSSNLNVISRTQDKNKNPLKPNEKLKWIQKIFPTHKIVLASPENSTIVDQLKQLHSKGVKHLTIVAGHDRIDDYQKMMARLNGPGNNKSFHFPVVKFVSSGPRIVDAEGVEGMSGTKMRQFVKVNDFKSFRRALPGHVPEKHAKELFGLVKKRSPK